MPDTAFYVLFLFFLNFCSDWQIQNPFDFWNIIKTRQKINVLKGKLNNKSQNDL